MRFQKFPIPATASPVNNPELHSRARSLALCSTAEARAVLEYEQACHFCALPLGFSGSGISRAVQIAVAAGTLQSQQSALKFACNQKIRCIEVDHSILSKAIEIAYRADDAWLENGLNALSDSSLLSELKSHSDLQSAELSSSKDFSSPVPGALRTLLEYAIARDASDIHLIPARNGMIVKLRINGDLLVHNQPVCSLQTASRLISRIKILSSLRIDERSAPQDGSFSLAIRNQPRQFRVSLLPTIHGEKCVLRITSDARARDLDSLGFSAASCEAIRSVINVRAGLLLLSGATGSGKSTTIYSIIQELLLNNLSISAVEDPVESHIDGISQTSLAPEKGLDYPEVLRSILRQDPDVIFIGEIRDSESARLVVSAALSGHLVLSTVHGSNIAESITRLLELGIEQNVLTRVLKLIITQSLIKKLCEKCKVIDLGKSNRTGLKIFRAVGCACCDYSGFDGRLILPERMCFSCDESLNDFISIADGDYSRFEGYESCNSYKRRYLQSGLIPAD